MLVIGASPPQKRKIVSDYASKHSIEKVVEISEERFRCDLGEHVPWGEVQMYRTFYRLLQELDENVLLVINEPLRNTDRACLDYNCIRNFLTRVRSQIVFSWLPMLESEDDTMVLVDFVTRSRWRGSSLSKVPEAVDVFVKNRVPRLMRVDVPTNSSIRREYAEQKEKLISAIGRSDPHIIPRKLHLLSRKHKRAFIEDRESAVWAGRGGSGVTRYKDVSSKFLVFEFCHRFRDFSDAVVAGRARKIPALVSDLKVDEWYFSRFQSWLGRQSDALSKIRKLRRP